MLVRRTSIIAVGSAFVLAVALSAAAQDACSVSATGTDAAWALPRTGAALGTGGMALAAARAEVTNVGLDAGPGCIPERVPLDTAHLTKPITPPQDATVAWMRPRSVSAFGLDFIAAPEGSVIRFP